MFRWASVVGAFLSLWVSVVSALVVPVPGQNLLEKRSQWAWQVLPIVVQACRVQKTCKMTDAEKEILDRVIANRG